MPCNTTHLLTAGRVLRRWEGAPGGTPIPLAEPGTAEAFLHGAIAPDMGFVPGVDRWVSELAHWVRPADLARALVTRARTPREQAFAWGWVAHLLTDVALHPLVGRACGERLRGDRSLRLNASADEATHVGMEVGLDILILNLDEEVPAPPGRPLLDRDTVEFVHRALEETYGLPWDAGSLVRTHRRAVRLSTLWPRALAVAAAGRGFGTQRARGPIRRALAHATASCGRVLTRGQTAAAGFFRPLHPPEWLFAEVRAEAERFPDRFREIVEGGIAELENRNLESGRPPGSGDSHPGEVAALRRLAELRDEDRSH